MTASINQMSQGQKMDNFNTILFSTVVPSCIFLIGNKMFI